MWVDLDNGYDGFSIDNSRISLADKPGQGGFGWHGMGGAAWGNHPGCPGDLRKAQRPLILTALQPSEEDDMKIWLVTDGDRKGWQLVEVADHLVHIDGPTHDSLVAAGWKYAPISGAVFAKITGVIA